MKITDLAIIFILLFIMLQVIFGLRTDVMRAEESRYVRMNNVCDRAIEDALETGYGGVDLNGNPVIDKESIKNSFIQEVDYIVTGSRESSSHQELISRMELMIVTTEKGFYVYRDGWKPMEQYRSKEHEAITEQIVGYIDGVLEEDGYYIDIPASEREALRQSFAEYGAYVVWNNSYGNNILEGKKRYIFSGARLRNV